MDSSTRIILSIIFGAGIGYFIGDKFFIEPVLWATFGAIFGIATDTTLRTMKNVKLKPNLTRKSINKSDNMEVKMKKPRQKPPQDLNF